MSSMDTTIQDMRRIIDRLENERGGFNLDALQHEVREWSDRNFGTESPLNSVKNVLGIIEEAGELVEEDPSAAVLMIALGRLSHSHLKELQGIRGTASEHQAKIKDAVGDIVVYLADYCGSRNFNFQEVVEQTWARVKQRDWTANKLHGGDVASHRELHPNESSEVALAQLDDARQTMPVTAETAGQLDEILRAQSHNMVGWEPEDQERATETDSWFVSRAGVAKLARHGLAISDTGTIIDMNKLEEQHAKDAAREALGREEIPF